MSTNLHFKEKSAKTTVTEFEQLSKKLSDMAKEINVCKNQLQLSSSTATIKQRLNETWEQVLTQAAHASTFAEALNQISRLYLVCEQDLIGKLSADKSKISNGETGTEKRNWFQQFWDWLWKKDVDPTYTATTREQEEAADREFQEQIAALLNSDRYSEETWAKSTVEERKQILTDYMNEVATILGVDVKSSIEFTNTPPKDGTVNMGAYNHGNRRVKINEYILQNDDKYGSYRLLTTITHELRHAYQHSAVDHPERYQVSQETIDAWKESFRTYSQEQAKGYDAYRNIVVEKDARKFAGQD